MKSRPLNKMIVPGLVVLAILLAAAPWVVRISFPLPGQVSGSGAGGFRMADILAGGGGGGGEVPVPDEETWSRPEGGDWAALADQFEQVRPDPPEPEEEDPDAASDDEEDSGPDPELDWIFLGSIIHDDLRVAQVRIGEDPLQRFLFEGDTAPDPQDPDAEVKILEVAASTLKVAWDGREHVLELGKPGSGLVAAAPENAQPASNTGPPSASGVRRPAWQGRNDPSARGSRSGRQMIGGRPRNAREAQYDRDRRAREAENEDRRSPRRSPSSRRPS